MGSSSITIGSNVSSIKAQLELSRSTEALSSVYTRLSSGQRINTASDDPAGLAVSTSLRADTRIYNQARRNLNDAVSMINVADGAMQQLSGIVTRIQELAEEAANGTLGAKQRESLDAEAQALKAEYSRITKTTSFNGLNVFDGTLKNAKMQSGYGSNYISISLGGSVADGGFATNVSPVIENGYNGKPVLIDVNNDSKLDLVEVQAGGGSTDIAVRFGNGDGTFQATNGHYVEDDLQNFVVKDINGDGLPDIVSVARWTNQPGMVRLRLNQGNGTFGASTSYATPSYVCAVTVADFNNDGKQDLLTAGSAGDPAIFEMRLGNGNGTFAAPSCFTSYGALTSQIDASDVNGDGKMDIAFASTDEGTIMVKLGAGDGTFSSTFTISTPWDQFGRVQLYDMNGDGALDVVGIGQNYFDRGEIAVALGNGNGTFKAHISTSLNGFWGGPFDIGDINADGIPDIAAVWGTYYTEKENMETFIGKGDGTFSSPTSYRFGNGYSGGLALGDVNGDKVLDMIFTGTGEVANSGRTYTFLGTASDYIMPIGAISLKTQSAALSALTEMKSILDTVSNQRGQLGSLQSRFASAISTLGSTIVEYTAAAGRISDADIATETSTLVRQQILQQAGSAVLSQANQLPALALKLLRG